MISALIIYLLLGILVTLVFTRLDTTPTWERVEFCTCCLLWPLGLLLVVLALIGRKLW